MRISASSREVFLKVVYYGPGMAGKTTNIQQLHQRCPRQQRGALVQIDTEADRTLFFDYFPFSGGVIGDYRVRIDFFTTPGQSFYRRTRRAVLEGVDGLVFVADSREDREPANLVARSELAQHLHELGRSLERTPHVYQWNKRDLRRATPVSVMEETLNPERAPSLVANAVDGVGVWETQSALLRLVYEQLKQQAPSRSPEPYRQPLASAS